LDELHHYSITIVPSREQLRRLFVEGSFTPGIGIYTRRERACEEWRGAGGMLLPTLVRVPCGCSSVLPQFVGMSLDQQDLCQCYFSLIWSKEKLPVKLAAWLIDWLVDWFGFNLVWFC